MEIKLLSIRNTVCIAIIVLTACSLGSCHKENNVPKSSLLSIGFQSSGVPKNLPIAKLDTAVLLGNPTNILDLEVTLLSPTNSQSMVSATIIPDTGALNAFNTNQLQNIFTPPQGWVGRSYIPYRQLPASDYTLQNGGKVTISPGQKSVKVRISFAGDKIDFYNKNAFENALSLKLVGANGATLVDSLSRALILIRAQSAYAGNYQTVGTESFSSTGSNSFNTNASLISVMPNTVLKQNFGSYGGLSYLTVNADNSVSINFLNGIPGPFYLDGLDNAILYYTPIPGALYSQNGVNKYDPVTKTFTLNYQYKYSGGTGNFTERLTLK